MKNSCTVRMWGLNGNTVTRYRYFSGRAKEPIRCSIRRRAQRGLAAPGRIDDPNGLQRRSPA
jgi:hypothetical protein